MKFSCPHCLNFIESQPDWAGLVVQCPHCGETITVPQGPGSSDPLSSSASPAAMPTPEPLAESLAEPVGVPVATHPAGRHHRTKNASSLPPWGYLAIGFGFSCLVGGAILVVILASNPKKGIESRTPDGELLGEASQPKSFGTDRESETAANPPKQEPPSGETSPSTEPEEKQGEIRSAANPPKQEPPSGETSSSTEPEEEEGETRPAAPSELNLLAKEIEGALRELARSRTTPPAKPYDIWMGQQYGRHQIPLDGSVEKKLRSQFAGKDITLAGKVGSLGEESFALQVESPPEGEPGTPTVKWPFFPSFTYGAAEIQGGAGLRKRQQVEVTGSLDDSELGVWWGLGAKEGEVILSIGFEAATIRILKEPEPLRLVDPDLSQGITPADCTNLLEDLGFIVPRNGGKNSFGGGFRFDRKCENSEKGAEFEFILGGGSGGGGMTDGVMSWGYADTSELNQLYLSAKPAHHSLFLEFLDRISPDLSAEGKKLFELFNTTKSQQSQDIGKLRIRINEQGLALESIPPPMRFQSETDRP